MVLSSVSSTILWKMLAVRWNDEKCTILKTRITVTLQTPESCQENVQTSEVAVCAGKGKELRK